MRTLNDIQEILQKGILTLQIPQIPQGLYDPIKYIMEDGGKRLRPLLLLIAAEAFGSDCSNSINQALAIEVFHNFTLLHDDIMDRAPIRRGRQTVHLKWNDNTAILSGDAMVILAYKLLVKGLSPKYHSEVMGIFNKAALEVCEGQQYDMDFESKETVSIEEYVEMIRLKTAVLLAGALQIGATLSGADKDSCDAIYKFGESLGLAFQIQDDLLDTYGDSSVFGKQIGGDIREGKNTFLRIQAFLKADEKQKQILISSRDYDEIRGVYDLLNVRESAQKAIENCFSIAVNFLDRCSGIDKSLLLDFANKLLKRDR